MVKGEPQLYKFLINPEYQDDDTFVCKGELFVGSVVKKRRKHVVPISFFKIKDI